MMTPAAASDSHPATWANVCDRTVSYAATAVDGRRNLREWPGVWLFALVLAVVMTAPVALHIGSRIPDSLDDPLLQAWQVAWDGYAVLHAPLHLFDANAFWPAHDSLAFSDPLLGYAPAGVIGTGPAAALVRYNLLYLFAYALAFVAAYQLARELGLSRLGATVAAAAFAYAPWRGSQAGHLHILSSGGIPLALFLLLRGYRRRSPAVVTGGWLVAAWQVSIGFSLGLPFLYALLLLAPLIAWHEWLRTDRLRNRGMVAATGAGAVLLIGASVALALQYVHARHGHPEARRPAALVEAFSPPPLSFLGAPAENVVWGYATSAIRERLYTPGAFAPVDEKTLFPGLAIVLLAGLGLARGEFPRSLRLGLGLGALVTGVLALGMSLGALSPYRLLYDYAPGWDAIRTPGRLAAPLTLLLALLAGAGGERLARRPERPRLGRALTLLIPVIVLFEGWTPPGTVAVPHEPAGFATAPAPALHLPSNRFVDSTYMYWSTDGFPRIVNGWSGFEPSVLTQVRAATQAFPSGAGARPLLRRIGVRSVVVHRPGLAPTVYRLGG